MFVLYVILLIKITCAQKRVCKHFEIKNLGQYHDFYVQSNTLLLADVFQNFQDMFLEIYELDPPIPAPGLV